VNVVQYQLVQGLGHAHFYLHGTSSEAFLVLVALIIATSLTCRLGINEARVTHCHV